MNRIVTLALAALMVIAFGTTALAQDALPVPAAESKDAPNNLIPNASTYNGEIGAESPIVWSSVGAAQYKIKFTVIRTGQKIKWTPTFACSPLCMNYEYPQPLFDAARDGDQIAFRITAVVGGAKYKSAKVLTTVNEVDAAELLTPVDGSIISTPLFAGFEWTPTSNTVKQTLIVKNAKNGLIALRTIVDISENCDIGTNVCAYLFGGENPAATSILKAGKQYKWYVVTKGVSGEKAKSPVFKLTTVGFTH